MPAYKVRLKQRKEVAEGTMAFYFDKPAGFEFNAGQFLNYTLIDPPETDPKAICAPSRLPALRGKRT